MDWLTDWQTDGQTEWQTDRLTSWQTDKLTDWPTEGQTDRLTDWLTDWQTDRLTDWQTARQTDKLTDWRTDWQTDRLTSWQTDWPCVGPFFQSCPYQLAACPLLWRDLYSLPKLQVQPSTTNGRHLTRKMLHTQGYCHNIHLRDELVKTVPQSVGNSKTVQMVCTFSCQTSSERNPVFLLQKWVLIKNIFYFLLHFLGQKLFLGGFGLSLFIYFIASLTKTRRGRPRW